MLVSGVNRYQTVVPMGEYGPQLNGSPTAVVARVMFGLSVNGRLSMVIASAKLSLESGAGVGAGAGVAAGLGVEVGAGVAVTLTTTGVVSTV